MRSLVPVCIFRLICSGGAVVPSQLLPIDCRPDSQEVISGLMEEPDHLTSSTATLLVLGQC